MEVDETLISDAIDFQSRDCKYNQHQNCACGGYGFGFKFVCSCLWHNKKKGGVSSAEIAINSVSHETLSTFSKERVPRR
jgi:hypothetical protein